MGVRDGPVPYFPVPPAQYDQRYFNEVMRAFSVYLEQARNPGTAVFNTVNVLGLSTYADNASAVAGGLSEGDVYKTATGELRIVI